jgi:molybdenum cofactor biosynthesis enzyme MoaA
MKLITSLSLFFSILISVNAYSAETITPVPSPNSDDFNYTAALHFDDFRSFLKGYRKQRRSIEKEMEGGVPVMLKKVTTIAGNCSQEELRMLQENSKQQLTRLSKHKHAFCGVIDKVKEYNDGKLYKCLIFKLFGYLENSMWGTYTLTAQKHYEKKPASNELEIHLQEHEQSRENFFIQRNELEQFVYQIANIEKWRKILIEKKSR